MILVKIPLYSKNETKPYYMHRLEINIWPSRVAISQEIDKVNE